MPRESIAKTERLFAAVLRMKFISITVRSVRPLVRRKYHEARMIGWYIYRA